MRENGRFEALLSAWPNFPCIAWGKSHIAGGRRSGLSLISVPQALREKDKFGQETKHVKIGHVKIDRAHFRVHFREHWKISREHWKFSREHSRGSFRGDALVCFTQKKPQPS